jgi:predicted component of type VI protein secretion system
MPAQLIALEDGLRILLDKPILLLGRDAECDIQFESRKISRRHCCIAQVGDRLLIRDLGSTNGIRINGVRVVEGALKPGDELTIGNHRYRVSGEAVPGAPSSKGKKPADKQPAPHHGPPELDDDLLEECDEPVPLADSGARRLERADKPAIAPPEPKGGLPVPPVLPEDLKLAPSSDSFPPYPAPPPAS